MTTIENGTTQLPQAQVPDVQLPENLSRVHRVGAFGRAAMVAAGLYATFHGGGLLDQAMDPFQDAGQVAASDLSHDPEITLDRQALSPAEKSLSTPDVLSWSRQDLARRETSDQRIERTMSDLDGHRYGPILDRAAGFRERQGDNIMSTREVQSYLDRLQEAKKPEESLVILKDFLHFYGKDAGFLSTTDVEGSQIAAFSPHTTNAEVQTIVRGTINAFSPLPKQLIRGASFNRLAIGSSKGLTLGEYNGSDLAIATHSWEGNIAQAALDALPNALQDPSSIQETLLHELGHAVAAGNGTMEETATPPFSPTAVLKEGGEEIIGTPGDVSQYATTDSDESYAEDFAHLFDTKLGIYSPDNTRQFGSAANAKMLRVLAPFELSYPGITDYIVSLNPHLMGNYSVIVHNAAH